MIHGGVLLEAWCAALFDGLVAGGVEEVVISPGSRSTPLVLAAFARAELAPMVVVDERAAAFFALGRARATHRPVALVRTSGTAAAHDLPAVVEASEAGHPLIVLTADRPHELMGVSAPQTIDQTRLFGAFARAYVDLGEPEASTLALRAVRRAGARAAATARSPIPGPVQVDVRARKPLEPPLEPSVEDRAFRAEQARRLADEPAPRTHLRAPAAPSPEALAMLKEALRSAQRPLLVAGPSSELGPATRSELLAWLGALRAPAVLEATSQLRLGPGGLGPAGLDAALRSPAVRAALTPDLVVQLGRPPVSTGAQRALAEWGCPRFVIAPHGSPDPESRAQVVEADLGAFARAAREAGIVAHAGEAYLRRFTAVADRAERVAAGAAARPTAKTLTEGYVARRAREAVPEGGFLAVGNSLPVRHLDQFVPAGGSAARVVHQRGASGIDGLVAGAIGVSRSGPCVLLLGDVSARHDLGALDLAEVAGELTVVVIDNGGGRIFEQLPVARQPLAPEVRDAFLTPRPRSLVPVARALGWEAARVHDPDELESALHAPLGPRFIEAVVPPDEARATLEASVRALDREAGRLGDLA